MADLQLNRPEAGQQIVVQDVADARLIFGFSPSDATMERQGDNLVFTFDDGSSIALENFYTAYSSEKLPDFEVDGVELSGADFFASLDSSLMPAAGPAAGAGAAAARNAAFHTWADSHLMDGIDRLGGLDLGFNGEPQQEATLSGLGIDPGPLNTSPTVINQYGNVVEDNPNATISTGGALTGSIAGDGTHTITWNPANSAQYGTFIQNPDGTYTYTLNNDNPNVQGLGQGETRTETFAFTYTDRDGDSSTANVIITITGTNDVPVLTAGTPHFDLKENGVGGEEPNTVIPGVDHAQGSFTVSDVDARDTQSVTITDATGKPVDGVVTDPATGVMTVTTPEGVFTLTPNAHADGSITYTYQYDLDNTATDMLNVGDSRDHNFVVTVADSAGAKVEQPVNIHIDGTNDQPALTLSHSVIGMVENQGVFHGTFQVVDHDADGEFNASTAGQANQRYSIAGGQDGEGKPVTGDATDSPATGGDASFVTDYGTLTINPDGTYVYAASDFAQSLAQGETRTESFDITVTDLHGSTSTQTITVTITGTNDVPTVGGALGGGLNLVESGVGSRDEYPDGGWAEGANQTQVSGTLNAEGKFTVKDADTTDSLSVTITDAKDNPVDGVVTDPTTGVMTVTDTYGTFTVTPTTVTNTDGSHETTYTYSYQLNDGVGNSLNKGDFHDIGYNISVSDGKSDPVNQPVNVHIDGTNDSPDITFSKVHVKESGVGPGGNAATTDDSKNDGYVRPDHDRVEVEGQLQATDPDSKAELTFGINVNTDDKSGVNTDGITVNLYTGEGQNTRPVLDTNGHPATETLSIISNTTFTNAAGHMAQTIVTEYGTLTLDTVTGNYTFALSEGAANHLGAGEKFDFHFTTTVTDEHGAQAHHNLGVTVEGTNDVPTLTLNQPDLITTEDGTLIATGTVSVVDPDAAGAQGEHFTFGIVDSSMDGTVQDTTPTMHTVVQGKYGYLTINSATGAYEYHLNDSLEKVQGLRDGESLQETFHIGVTDKAGGFDIKDVTITVQGTDEAPFVNAGVHIHNVIEAGVIPGSNTSTSDTSEVSGQVTAHDPDIDQNTGEHQTLTYSFGTAADGSAILTVNTNYGSISIDQTTGAYTYRLNNGSDAVNRLLAGETHQDRFPVHVTDPDGNDSTQDVIINIQGSNDRPIVDSTVNQGEHSFIVRDPASTQPSGGLVLEDANDSDGSQIFAGQVKSHDPDAGENELRYSVVNSAGKNVQTLEGKYGYLTIDQANGEYTYHLYNDSDAVQNLGKGDRENDDFTVSVTDSLGVSSSSTIHIVVEGQDDDPTITGGTNASVTEDNGAEGIHAVNPSTTGTVLVDDVDSLDTGREFYFLDKDGHKTHSLEGQWGSIHIHPDTGVYTYELTGNANLQNLNTDSGVHDKFTVHVSTSHGDTSSSTTGTINVTISGANDNPTIVADQSDLNIELNAGGQVQTSASGSLTASDVDDTNWTFHLTDSEGHQLQTATGQYGALTLTPDGTYTYALNIYSEAFRSIGAGGERTEHFSIDVYDEHGGKTTQEVTVTVHGVDSGATDYPNGSDSLDYNALNWSLDLSVTEDAFGAHGGVSSTGTFVDRDGNPVNLAAPMVFSFQDARGEMVQTVRTDYGSVTIDPHTGQVTYTLDNSSEVVQSLGANDFIGTGRLPVWINGHETSMDVKLITQGVNDAPDISAAPDLTVRETEGMAATGRITADDVDQGTVLQYWLQDGSGKHVGSITTEFGTITINPATGEYTYTMAAGSHQNAEWSYNEHFTVVADDGSGQANATDSTSVTVTLHGTNTPPTLTMAAMEVTEDGVIMVGLTPGVTDDMDGLHFSLTDATGQGNAHLMVGTYGTLLLDSNTGEYTYRLDNNNTDVQGLGAGESHTDTFFITVTDKQGATDTRAVEVTIHGTNDNPKLFVGPTLLTGEGATEAVIGNATALDADLGDTLASGNLQFGFGFAKNVDGTLAIDVNGHPVPVTDVTNDYGTFHINPATGEYSFTVNNDSTFVQGLNMGQVHSESVTVVVADSSGATDSRDLTVNITGANSTPEFVAGFNAAVTEDISPAVTETVQATDPDSAAILRYFFALPDGSAAQRVQTDHGVLTIDARTGSYTYTLNNGQTDVQGLGVGESILDHATVTVTDQYGATSSKELEFTIHGANDAPVITSATSSTAGASVNTGTLAFTDADVHDTHSLAILINGMAYAVEAGTATVDGLGSFAFSQGANGWNYIFTASDAAQNAFMAGTVVDHNFQIQVSDGQAQTSSADLHVSVTGTNAQPTITGSAVHDLSLGALVPDGDLAISGNLGDYIVDDHADALHVTFADATSNGDVAGTFGTLHFDAESGSYSYSLNTSEDGLRQLAQTIASGGELAENFHYAASDGVWDDVAGTVNIHLQAPHAQVALEQGGVLHGDAGNNLLLGQTGNDQLSGGNGDDLLFGGAGDDYLNGDSGHNQLYGGNGNDILVFNSTDSVYNGGIGIDFLVGADRSSLDGLLGENSPVHDVEVFVTHSPANLDITSMGDLSALGISVNAGTLSLSDAWTAVEPVAGDSGLPDGFTEYVQHGVNGGDDMNIVVQKTILENHNG